MNYNLFKLGIIYPGKYQGKGSTNIRRTSHQVFPSNPRWPPNWASFQIIFLKNFNFKVSKGTSHYIGILRIRTGNRRHVISWIHWIRSLGRNTHIGSITTFHRILNRADSFTQFHPCERMSLENIYLIFQWNSIQEGCLIESCNVLISILWILMAGSRGFRVKMCLFWIES